MKLDSPLKFTRNALSLSYCCSTFQANNLPWMPPLSLLQLMLSMPPQLWHMPSPSSLLPLSLLHHISPATTIALQHMGPRTCSFWMPWPAPTHSIGRMEILWKQPVEFALKSVIPWIHARNLGIQRELSLNAMDTQDAVSCPNDGHMCHHCGPQPGSPQGF